MLIKLLIFCSIFLTNVLVAGEAVGGTPSINDTHCVCTVDACCLCVEETMTAALTVSITSGEAIDSGDSYTVHLIECPNQSTQEGPRFNSPNGGTISDPVMCDGSPNVFKIYAGKKAGEFKVFIRWTKGDQSGCTECGTICVFPIDRQNYKREEECNKYPASYSTPEGKAKHKELEDRGFEYQGPICGMEANEVVIDLEPRYSPPYGRPSRNDTPLDEFVYVGEPYSNLPGGGQDGDRFDNPCLDDCKNRIELFCSGNSFNFYFVDCNNNYYYIGFCEWDSANNFLSTTKTECGGKKRFSNIKLENNELLPPGPDGIPEESGVKNLFIFDTCTKRRIHVRTGPDGVSTSQTFNGQPLTPPVK